MNSNSKIIISRIGEVAYNFIEPYLSFDEKDLVLDTHTLFNIEATELHQYDTIVNLHRVNDFKEINTYYFELNKKLTPEGRFISCVETFSVRKKRLLRKFVFPFNYLYYIGDVMLTRVSPKIPLTSKLYYFLSVGKGLVLSKTETFGRLHYLGFEIEEEKVFNNMVYFVAKKSQALTEEPPAPSTGLILKLPRVAQHKKIVTVYKLRTMHTYSQFIQEYVYEKHGTSGDKAYDDFRVSSWGKFLRKYWLDELPMLWNLLKGDIKLIGVRPLSQAKFDTYPSELQDKRTLVKPGLLPPYYADNPKDQQAFFETEDRYLNQYLQSPLKTDFQYFFRILQNIIFGKRRSA